MGGKIELQGVKLFLQRVISNNWHEITIPSGGMTTKEMEIYIGKRNCFYIKSILEQIRLIKC